MHRSATPGLALDWRQNLVRTVLLSTVQPSSSDDDTSFISNSSMERNNTNYDVRRVPHVKLSTLLEESGLSFDTIVANCEGCLKAPTSPALDVRTNPSPTLHVRRMRGWPQGVSSKAPSLPSCAPHCTRPWETRRDVLRPRRHGCTPTHPPLPPPPTAPTESSRTRR